MISAQTSDGPLQITRRTSFGPRAVLWETFHSDARCPRCNDVFTYLWLLNLLEGTVIVMRSLTPKYIKVHLISDAFTYPVNLKDDDVV